MIRYRKLGYVELNVSNLEKSREFYETIVGLEYVGTDDRGAVLLRCDSEHHSVALHQSSVPGFRCVGWMLEDISQFDVLHRCLRAAAIPLENMQDFECHVKSVERATRITEPYTGATQEFYVPLLRSSGASFSPSHTKIQRLGHIVFATPKVKEAIAFYKDILNFQASDSIGDRITFMRPFPSPFHHGLGLGLGPRSLFHHLNFMVSEVDDIGKALNRCRRNDVPVVFGPGRHVASGSVFLYFLDPDGMTLEYSYGMEEFPEVTPRMPRVLPVVPESLDTWGAVLDPRMASKGEVQPANIGAELGP